MCRPAGNAGNGEDRREQIHRQSQHAVYKAAVEVHIGTNALIDLPVLGDNFLGKAFHGGVQLVLSVAALFIGKLFHKGFQDHGSGVGYGVHRMTHAIDQTAVVEALAAEQPLEIFPQSVLVLPVGAVLLQVFEHLHNLDVRPAVLRSFQRAQCRSSDEGALELNTDQRAKLKSISGHDRLTVDKKNSNQVSFTSTCKVIIASNHNIGMAYSSSDSAIARRICTLPFNVKIPKSQQNPNIVSEILGSELNAVTTEALNAFFKLKANGYHFAGDDAGLDDYALQFTPINAQYHNIKRFVQCYVRSMPGNFVLTKDLYDVFQHCLDFNCDVFKDVTGFSQALNNYLLSNGYVVKKVKKHQGNGYEGIAISNS